MTITVALSYGVRTMLHRQSIYTEKLARRGHDIPAALQANFYQLKKTRDIMDTQFVAVPADGSLDDFVRHRVRAAGGFLLPGRGAGGVRRLPDPGLGAAAGRAAADDRSRWPTWRTGGSSPLVRTPRSSTS